MNISTENINTLAQLVSSIGDGDYIYIYKASSNSFARIEKSLLLGSGDGSTSAATIANVNLLQAKIDELIGKLANSAFALDNSKPEQIGELDWGSSGETVYYYISGISSSNVMYSVSNSATRVQAGSDYENVITANSGYDLNSVTVNGVAQSVSNNTCTISISNVQANITISVSARVHVDPSASYSVTPSLTDLQLEPNGGTVVQGGTFTGTLSLANGVSGKRLPDDITVNGTYGELTYTQSSGAIEITNIQSNITIVAAAVSTAGDTIYTEADCTIQDEYVRWNKGNFQSYNGFRHSGYLPINPGQEVNVKTNYSSNEAGLAFFQDTNGTYCGNFNSGIYTGVKYDEVAESNSGATVNAPENAAYFVFSVNGNNSANRVTVTVKDEN